MRAEPIWSSDGVEPSLEDVMVDPLVHLVMQRDGLTVDAVWAALRTAQRRLQSGEPTESIVHAA